MTSFINHYFHPPFVKIRQPQSFCNPLNKHNTFTLTKGWTTELNASFNSGGQYGFMVLDPQWGLAAGVQKTIMRNKDTLRFNISDIFSEKIYEMRQRRGRWCAVIIIFKMTGMQKFNMTQRPLQITNSNA